MTVRESSESGHSHESEGGQSGKNENEKRDWGEENENIFGGVGFCAIIAIGYECKCNASYAKAYFKN